MFNFTNKTWAGVNHVREKLSLKISSKCLDVELFPFRSYPCNSQGIGTSLSFPRMHPYTLLHCIALLKSLPLLTRFKNTHCYINSVNAPYVFFKTKFHLQDCLLFIGVWVFHWDQQYFQQKWKDQFLDRRCRRWRLVHNELGIFRLGGTETKGKSRGWHNFNNFFYLRAAFMISDYDAFSVQGVRTVYNADEELILHIM